MNHLFYGDNLEVLRRHVEDASVDLVYLDPPFQSGRDYSVLFEARAGERGRARADAFTDTWGWGEEAEEMYVELERLGGATAKVMRALRSILRESDIMAYLCMMAPRLIELRRVLKASGSLYLHCDPTASHYLKILLDNVLGPGCFRNEIIWRYRRWPTTARRFQRMHDVVLFYTARPGTEHTWSSLYGYESLAESTLKTFGTRKQKADFSSGHRKPGVEDKPSEGPPLSDVWDVSIIAPIGKERTGYPTQKPEALLERIIKASSREGDVVLDPFCGSGTTIRVAEKLGRRWIGIDVTHLAIHVAKTRVDPQNCEVVGEPRSLTDVRRLAETAPTQFQWWMLGAIGAQPATKKSADVGFDGELYFKESAREPERTIGVWVRTGKVLPAHVREFVRMMDREGMAMGVLLTLQAPSGATLREAAEAGELASTLGRFPRLQIVTAKDVVAGVAPELPPRRPAAAIAVGAA